MARSRSEPPLALRAVCTPGLERVLAAELHTLNITPRDAEPGSLSWPGTAEQMQRTNLWLRTASRITVQLGSFHARAFGELERRARELPWERFVARGQALRFRVTCRKSRLYHTAGVAERVGAAVAAHVGDEPPAVPEAQGEDDGDDAQLIIVRLLHDRCTVSVDSSGALLHRRGYRLATAKAPMRETLAAAMLLASGWDAQAPLLDPFCGAGTIPIEGALLARRIAPGARRTFAFQRWPAFDASDWQRLVHDAREGERLVAPCPILGSDRDAGAVRAAAANAERAGVAADVAFSRLALSAISPPPGPGWLVTNPPYGVRVGDRRALRDLYAQLGNVWRARCPGWKLVLLSADPRLAAALGAPLETIAETRNGGIDVRIVTA